MSAAVPADVDGDGDPDLVIGNSMVPMWFPYPRSAQNRIQYNLTQQIVAATHSMVGKPVETRIHVRSPYSSSPFATVTLLAAGRLRIPLPPLGLDPTTLIVLPVTQTSGGISKLDLNIPAIPSLLDARFHLQAIAEGQDRSGRILRLTNVTTEQIVR